MLIRDKQELRRCVKQSVRRAEIAEAALCFDMASGLVGPQVLFDGIASGGTPFSFDAQACYAALDALGLPTDRQKALTIADGYDRAAWLREIFDTLHARCVLADVLPEKAAQGFADDRVSGRLLVRGEAHFARGRYGVDYTGAAQRLGEALEASGIRHIAAEGCALRDLRDCLLPFAEDTGSVLHICLAPDEIPAFAALLREFPGARCVVRTKPCAEEALIGVCRDHAQLLFVLSDAAHLHAALEQLGTRFQAYSAAADSPEMLLGRWAAARERLWQRLADAYLPAARVGCVLTSEQIEEDVRRILGGALMEFVKS